MTSTAQPAFPALECSSRSLGFQQAPSHCIPSPLLCWHHLKGPSSVLPACSFLLSSPGFSHLITVASSDDSEAVARATVSWFPIPSGRKCRTGTQTWMCRLGTDLCHLVLPPPSPKLLFILQYPALGAPPPEISLLLETEGHKEFSDDLVVRIPGFPWPGFNPWSGN